MLLLEHTNDHRIATLTLNRPDKRNALNAALVKELIRYLNDLATDSRMRVVILTGAGNVFSAGADLQALQQLKDASLDDNLNDSLLLAELFVTMRTVPYIILARVQGHAIAGGGGLVAASDLAIASDGAKFGFTEVRIGFVPALVNVLLEDRISSAHRRDLFLSGRLIDAKTALRMGLIHRVTTDLELDDLVRQQAADLARNTSRNAVARTKSLLHGPPDAFRKRMESAAHVNAEARGDSECQAGVASFLDRVDPPWVRAWDADHHDRA
ncbi:MAG: enoyl-CoA hydratase-related protein [Rhodothermales bacterium]